MTVSRQWVCNGCGKSITTAPEQEPDDWFEVTDLHLSAGLPPVARMIVTSHWCPDCHSAVGDFLSERMATLGGRVPRR